MGNLTHAAGRLAVSKVSDVVLKNLDKDREKEIVKLVDFMEKYMDGEKLDINYEKARTMITDKNGALNHYINRLLDEVDPHVLKTMVLNLGFEAFLNGTKTIRKMQCTVADFNGSDKCLQPALYGLLGGRIRKPSESDI